MLKKAITASALLAGAVVPTSALAAPSAPPTTAWVSHTTNNATDYVAALSTSAVADGSSITGGQFVGSNVDFGGGITRTSGNNGSLRSAFTMALNADGSTKWVVSSTGPAGSLQKIYGVGARADGTSVIGGYWYGTGVNLGDGVSRTSGNNGTWGAALIMGLNTDGTIAWTRTPGGATSRDLVIRSVDAVEGGGSVATGWFWGTNVDFGDGVPRTSAKNGTNYSAFTMSLNADGTIGWVHVSTAPGTSDTEGWGVTAVGSGGESITTGFFKGANVDLGDGVLRTSANNGASRSLYTMRLNADGTTRWVYRSTAAGASSATGYGVDALPDGTSTITGYFQGTNVDLGDGIPRTSNNQGSDNASFTIRLNADGVVQWVVIAHEDASGATCYGPGWSDNNGESASMVAGGATVTNGTFCGTNVDLGDGVPRTSANNGYSYSAYVMAFADDGTALWTQITNDSNPDQSRFSTTWNWGVSALPDGSVFNAGEIDNGWPNNIHPVDFGNGFSIIEPWSTAYTWKLSSVPLAAPMNAKATPGDSKATVSWDAVPGPSITSYTVTAGPGGKTCSVDAPATTCTIEGLTNGTEYTFTVVANNAQGGGPASASAKATPSGAATPPADSSASSSGGQAAADTSPKITIPSASVAKGATLTTAVNPSVAGTVKVTATLSGRTVCTATRKATKAGRMMVTCTLSDRAKAAIRMKAVTLKVTSRLTDAAGKTATASRNVKVARYVVKTPVTG